MTQPLPPGGEEPLTPVPPQDDGTTDPTDVDGQLGTNGQLETNSQIDTDDPAHTEEQIDVGRESVARGARWNVVTLFAKQFSRILFSVVLARLLGPENFGIVAQASIYIAFSGVLLDVGVGSAIIQRENLDRKTIGTATVLNLGVVAFLVLFTMATADLWASFFSTPELGRVLRVLSLTLVFNGLAVVPSALLIRRLRFKLLGLAEVVSSTLGGVLAVAAAVGGAGYWALVLQTLTRDLLVLVVVLAVAGPPVLAWSRSAYQSIIGFSRNVLGAQLLGFAGGNADNFLISWRLGPTALASYALSYRVLLLPVQILGQTANRLVFPVFSRLNHRSDRQASYFATMSSSLSLAVTPAMVLVCLSAPTAVPIVFGSRWDEAIVPMQILAMGSILRALMTIHSAALMACGKANWVFRWNLIGVPAHVVGFAIGVHWGIVGVAWSYLIVGFPLGIMWHLMVTWVMPLSHRMYLAAIAPAIIGGAGMAGAWALYVGVLGARVTGISGLAVASLVGLVGYALPLVLFWREGLRRQLGFLRLMAGRSNAEAV